MMAGLTRLYRRLVGAGTLTVVAVGVALTGGPAPTAAAPVTGRAGPVLADQVRDDQWQLRELNAEAAWQASTGKGVTVAVIDSGVDGTHPDLVGQVLPGTDLVRTGGDGQFDPVGHGTTVAGLIAGRRDDADGVEGLAPDARILPVRVLDEENRYDDALIVAQGVRWAVDHGAQVINMSLGGTGDSPALAAALDYAFTRDVVVIACTGNLSGSSPYDRVWYPAREPGIVSVSGLDRDTQTLWSGSITGRETVLSAPATGLIGARPGGFWQVQGTSFAAPLVTATAALVRSRWPSMSAADVVNRLIRTARDLGPKGRDAQFGFGLVDPVAALGAQVPAVAGNPLDDDRSPGMAGFGPSPGNPDQGRDQPRSRQVDQAAPATGAPEESHWAAQPAGVSARRSIDPRWAVVALGVALLSAIGALLGLRLRRTGG